MVGVRVDIFFFFSSRRRHTRLQGDWSSDVCSSDLAPPAAAGGAVEMPADEFDLARRRIAELERKIGQQQVELDFFRQALRRVKEARRPSTGPGVTGSTRSSKP